MSEGRRTEERPSASLAGLVLDRFRARIDPDEQAWAGEESVGWRAEAADGVLFVQRFPPWRSPNELGWCQGVARAAAAHSPESVAAHADQHGTIVFETDEGPVCVFPFVEGTHPVDGRAIAGAGAELLARIHRGLVGWAGPGRPVGTNRHPPTDEDRPPILDDPELDTWERLVADAAAPAAAIHGDFYPGNLIVDGPRIVGVIDWTEARVEPQAKEVAWAAWEFCHNEPGDDIVDEEARVFLVAYLDAGGPADVGPEVDLIPWIRRRLRDEATSAWNAAGDLPLNSPYHAGQIRAFHGLRGRRLSA